MGIAERIGTALVRPRAALELADEGKGRSSGDAFALLGLKVLCAELPALVAAVWTVLVLGAGVGMGNLVHALDDALRLDIVIIFGATLVITVGAGKRRDWSRDFDLASVVWLPALAVGVAGSLIALFVGPAPWLRQAATAVAAIWVAGMCLPAIKVARARGMK
jgi:hypothetical protein